MALMDVKGLGNKRIIELLERFPSIESVFDAGYQRFSDIGFVNEDMYSRIQDATNASEAFEDRLRTCEESGIQIISYNDEPFPTSLRKSKATPLLFAKGDTEILDKPSLSIVGSRESNSKSEQWVFNIAKQLSEEGFVIVSGGALGIDTAAHKGALAGSGETICVLGSGINNVYPPENSGLIDKISREGLVVSNRAPKENVNRFSLLDRNEITSGLSSAVLIATSTGEGGTSSQFEDARSQNKTILCPNPALNFKPSEGISQMLEAEETESIQDIDDILDDLNSTPGQKSLEDIY